MVANVGLKSIYYGEFYRDDRIFDAAKKLRMIITQIKAQKTS